MKFQQLLLLSSCAWLSRAFVLPSGKTSASVQQSKSVLNLVQRATETYRPYDTAYSGYNRGMRSRYSPGYGFANGENLSSTNPMRYQSGYYNDRGYDYYNGRRGYDSYYNRPYDSYSRGGRYGPYNTALKADITGFPGENSYYRSSRYLPVYSSDARIPSYEGSYYGRGGRMYDPYYYDNSYNYGDMRYGSGGYNNRPMLLADRLRINGNYYNNNNYDSYGGGYGYGYNRRYSPYYSPSSYNDGWGVRSYDNSYGNGYYGNYGNGYYGNYGSGYGSGYYGNGYGSGYYGNGYGSGYYGNGYGSGYYGSGYGNGYYGNTYGSGYYGGGGYGSNRPMLLNDRLKYGGW